MKIFLAAVSIPMYASKVGRKFNGLETFAHLPFSKPLDKTYYRDFILDSGAFTYAYSTGDASKVDWDVYVRRYADYIKRNDIKNYMELDIDKIVGYDKVLEFRRLLEKETGRPCIPVWHTNRGLKEWTNMCKQYKWVAIGGIRQEIGKKRFQYLQYFIDEAHRYGTMVHGLGYTRLNDLANGINVFDTVDSTSWLSAGKFGNISVFDGKRMNAVKKPAGKKCRLDYKTLNTLSLSEWIDYANYMEGIKYED